MSTRIYDKLSWHYPEGKGCPGLENAKIHFQVIMEWLNNNNLLTDYGKEIFELGIDSDFSLTEDMMTAKGNNILKKIYREWLKTVNYNFKPSVDILNKELEL